MGGSRLHCEAVPGTVPGRERALLKVVKARAHPNVALVKYWGKRDLPLNLPSVGSISLTLGGLFTEVTVQPSQQQRDEYWSNGILVEGAALREVENFIDLFRAMAGMRESIVVRATSNFPVAAGLASSASTFAALTVALATFYGLDLPGERLSALARRGSGSACRSLWGGFVEWHRGESPDGSDSFASPLESPPNWPITVLVAITDPRPKPIVSRTGMVQSQSSPFYSVWVSEQEEDLREAREAIRTGSLEKLGAVAERNCLKMHAVAFTAQRPLVYWRPATLAAMETVWNLRAQGLPAYFTIDAGPQVKVLCPSEHKASVQAALAQTPGVREVLVCHPGGPAVVLENNDSWT